MRRFPGVLFPVLLAACPGSTGGTTATDTTGSSGTSASDTTDAQPTTTTPGTETQADTTTTATTTGTTTTGDVTTTGTGVGPGTTDSSGSTSTDSSGGTSTDSSGTASTGTGGDCTPGDVQDCYGGPDGTMGIGDCAAGSQECGPGGSWGPCVGEVVPAPETCDAPGDENCDGVDPCQGELGLEWSRGFGSAGTEEGLRVEFDGAGNVVVAARGSGSIDFGGGALNSAGSTDVFLAKFSPAGAHLWSKRFGDVAAQAEHGLALTVTAEGDIVLAGDFKGAIDLGGGPFVSQNNGDIFLARFDGAGAHVWSKAFKAGSYAYAEDVAVDGAGDIVLAGYFLTTLDLGGGALNSAGLVDAFVGKFSGDGGHQWSQRFGDGQGQYIISVATDGADNIYMTGGFQGTINPGNGQLVSAGAADIFVFKFNAGGTAIWAKRFGDASNQVGRGLEVDAQGRVSLMAEVSGTIDFGGGPIAANGTSGAVAQFDGAGAHVWSRALCTVGSGFPRAMGSDGLGNLLLTGTFSNQCQVGADPLISDGGGDIFVAKLGHGGDHVWSRRFGDFQNQEGKAIAGSAAGAVAVCGLFEGGVNFGDGPKISQGGADGFVAVFVP